MWKILSFDILISVIYKCDVNNIVLDASSDVVLCTYHYQTFFQNLQKNDNTTDINDNTTTFSEFYKGP